MKKREQGVLTIEATIVLTVMTLFVFFLFSFARLYRAQNMVSHAAIQAADAVALESYLRETALMTDVDEVVNLVSGFVDSTALTAESFQSLRSADVPKIARERFAAAINATEEEADATLKWLGVKDGLSGISFENCRMDLGNDDVIVALEYTLKLQFPLFGAEELSVTKSAKAKTFGNILFEVSTAPNHIGWGVTKGDAKVTYGTTVTISAANNYGYVFTGWDDDGDGVVDNTDNPRDIVVTDAMHFIGVFAKEKFGVNIDTDIEYDEENAGMVHREYGTVTGAATYEYLDPAPLTATPSEHYEFVGWDDDGDGVIDHTEPTRTLTVDKTYHIKAVFKPCIYTVQVESDNTTYGSVSVQQGALKGTSIQAEYGSNVLLTATPNHAVLYIFSKWSNNSTQTSQTVMVQGDTTYIGSFIENTYEVWFYASKSAAGAWWKTKVIRGSSIDGSKAYISAEMPTNRTTGEEKFPGRDDATFLRWICNGTQFKSSTIVNGNIKVYPLWNCRITYNPNGGIMPGKTNTNKVYQDVSDGTLVDFSRSGVIPTRAGYNFDGWFDDDGNQWKHKKEITANVTVTAKWVCNHQTVGDSRGEYLRSIRYYREEVDSNGTVIDTCLRKESYKCDRCQVFTREVTTGFTGADHNYGGTCNAACNVNHAFVKENGWCGNAENGVGMYHTWNGRRCVLCQYCSRRESKGYTPDGRYIYAYWCSMHPGWTKEYGCIGEDSDELGGYHEEMLN